MLIQLKIKRRFQSNLIKLTSWKSNSKHWRTQDSTNAKDQMEPPGVMTIKSTPSRINNALCSKETSLETDKLMLLSPKRSKEPEEPSLKKAPALPLSLVQAPYHSLDVHLD
jgi:enterochelin esterase-like enzyme